MHSFKIKIHQLSWWFCIFGHNPNTTGYAQVRLLLACQPCIHYVNPLKRIRSQAFLWEEGGGEADGRSPRNY